MVIGGLCRLGRGHHVGRHQSGVQFSLSLIALKALPVLMLGGFTSSAWCAIVGGLIIGVGRESGRSAHWGPMVGNGATENWFAYVLGVGLSWCSGPRACSGRRSSNGCEAMFYREAGDFSLHPSYAGDEAKPFRFGSNATDGRSAVLLLLRCSAYCPFTINGLLGEFNFIKRSSFR